MSGRSERRAEQEIARAAHEQELRSAAARYEDALASESASLDVLLDLAILYWQTTDPGMAAALQGSGLDLSTAESRMRALLCRAIEQYPTSSEPHFWARYVAWADVGESLTIDECEALLARDPTCLAPVLFIVSASGGRLRRVEAEQLLEQSREFRTARSRYVTSVLVSALSSVRGSSA